MQMKVSQQMLEFLKNNKILVVVAHPDDELLGLGGTINKIKDDNEINLLILGEGITSRSTNRNVEQWEKELKKHKENTKKATKIVGYDLVEMFDLPDNRFDSVELLDIIKIIEFKKKEFKPNVILTHHAYDLNIDHQKTFEAVLTSSRPLKEESVKSIITFETPSSTEWQSPMNPSFQANLYVALDKKNIQAKIQAMEQYQYEKRDFPHPRSAKSLEIHAMKRGVEIGERYAEAFMIIRNIIN